MGKIRRWLQRKPTEVSVVLFPEGVKEVHCCPNPIVDVCFIHGLTGDREATWTAHDEEKPWIELLLPSRLKYARILTWGYDAYLVRKSTASSNCLADHANNLLTDLTNDRNGKEASARSLIFVAHSLGGLVCKAAILISKDNPEPHLKKIFQSTQAIAFMGTPHQGSWIANWSSMPAGCLGVFKSVNRSLLSVLQTNDEYLASLQTRFRSLLRDLKENHNRSLHVTCFFEELAMTHVVGKVVSKESATFDGYSLASIHANHSGMVKFRGEHDNGFKRVLGELLRWESDLRTFSGPKNNSVQDSPHERTNVVSDAEIGKLYLPSSTSGKLCFEFEDREGVIEEINMRVKQTKDENEMPFGLIYGIPGIGKTQVCLKFAKTLRKRYDWIWLVNAESTRALEHDYTNIARNLRLRSTNNYQDLVSAQDYEQASQPENSVVNAVKTKLSSTKTSWILIFDNFNSTEGVPLHHYLPNNVNGIVLVCAPTFTATLDMDRNFHINVLELHKEHLERIFWNCMQFPNPKGDLGKSFSVSVQRLVGTLGSHTLSIRLAAAYLCRDSGGRPTVNDCEEYIAAFQHNGDDLPPQLRDIHEPLWQSFKLIIDKLKGKDEEKFRDASKLLQFKTMFSHRHLPKRLFDHPISESDPELGFLSNGMRYKEATRVLVALGLIMLESVQEEHGTSMLQVLHRCARARMWIDHGAEATKLGHWRTAIRILGTSIPSESRQEDINFRRMIVPHIDACFDNYTDPCTLLLDGNLDLEVAIKALLDFSRVYLENGRFNDSKTLQHRANIKSEAAFGPINELTLRAKSELAVSLDILGDSKGSLQLRERVYRESKEKYSSGGQDSCLADKERLARRYHSAAADLAVSYSRHVAHRREALRLRKEVLSFAEAANQSSHCTELDRNQVLKAKRNYAMSLFEFDNRKEALRLREEVCNSLVNSVHDYAWNARRELVVSLVQTGQVIRATRLAKEILASRTKALGDDHPDTCVALATRAAVHLRSEEHPEALKLLREVVEKSTRIWGQDHLMTLHARIDLGSVLLKLRGTHESALGEATDIQRDVLETLNKRLEPEDFEVLMAKVQMARIIQCRNPKVAAAKLLDVIKVLQQYDDPYHDVVLFKYVDCLILLKQQSEAAQALENLLTAQHDRTTRLKLKAMVKLATLYLGVAEDYDPLSRDPLGSVREIPQNSEEVISCVSWRPASDSSSQDLPEETFSVHTLDVPSEETFVYHEYTREDLVKMCLDLRKKVVKTLDSANTEEIRHHEVGGGSTISDSFTAQAYNDLAQSYARESLYDDAVVLQRKVVSYFDANWGRSHQRTCFHKRRLDEWMRAKAEVLHIAKYN